MLTVTLPPPVPLIPVLTALIAVLNCPVVDTLVALTCTGPVVEAAQMPCASGPSVEIGPDAVTVMGPPGVSIGLFMIILLLLRILPLSARMPNAPGPVVVIGPEELTAMLPPTDAAAMPMPFPPSVLMLPGLNNDTEIGASAKLNARMPRPSLRRLGSAAAAPSMLIADCATTVTESLAAAEPDVSAAIPGFSLSPGFTI